MYDVHIYIYISHHKHDIFMAYISYIDDRCMTYIYQIYMTYIYI